MGRVEGKKKSKRKSRTNFSRTNIKSRENSLVCTVLYANKNTVGKQTPCKLSFVYTSQVNLTVRTEPKFGKYLMPFM